MWLALIFLSYELNNRQYALQAALILSGVRAGSIGLLIRLLLNIFTASEKNILVFICCHGCSIHKIYDALSGMRAAGKIAVQLRVNYSTTVQLGIIRVL